MNDELRKKATMYTAQFELGEFYSAVAYSGYKHAIDKLNEVLADFAAECVRAERERLSHMLIAVRRCARNDAQEWLVGINEVIDELREAK